MIGNPVVSGRPTPDASIDQVTISAGRWWQAPGEIVLDQDTAALLGKRVGGHDRRSMPAAVAAGRGGAPGGRSGQARDAGGYADGRRHRRVGQHARTSRAWMSPTDLATLDPGRDARSGDALPGRPRRRRPPTWRRPRRRSRRACRRTRSSTSTTYLDLKADVDRIAELYVPVLLAFSIFALLAAAFTIANVVGGVVLTSYRDIGVMKAVGFTPAQVSLVLVGQILVPVDRRLRRRRRRRRRSPASRWSTTPRQSFGLPAAFALSLPVVVGRPRGRPGDVACSRRSCRPSAPGGSARSRRSPAGAAPSTRPDGGRLRRLGLAAAGRPPGPPRRRGRARPSRRGRR